MDVYSDRNAGSVVSTDRFPKVCERPALACNAQVVVDEPRHGIDGIAESVESDRLVAIR